MLFAFEGCNLGPKPCDTASTCDGQETCATGSCEIDACVESTSVEEAVDCCIAAHGYGLEEADVERLESSCVGDACRPDQYLSSASALCIAQVHGLQAGIGDCAASFVEVGADGTSFAWWVFNVHEQTCSGDPLSGDFIVIDAVSGSMTSSGSYSDD